MTDVTPRLVSGLLAQSNLRMPPAHSPAGARLAKLIDAEAWTEVALALIEIGLPEWRLMRLAVDDGEWCCALSRHWYLPDWLDDAIETRHEVLPLAVLAAFADACRASAPARLRSVPGVRQPQSEGFAPVCCDNFR